ncbi:hypothetical protein BC777_0851 [Yoonia maricola]|uniref:Uncharacterized protein n=1 Tax=Yoonia maricola TaxID=420999 RepID=A0A2M8WM60_9RHOB|nr:hypothetical protein [Yoonia maricola]PJI92009.1 hypothetical protein BC777_0851 [Yoonia maricola]
MGMAKQDINDFRARVKNINNPRNNSYYDPDLGMHIPKRVPRNKLRKQKVQHGEDAFVGAFVVALVLGAVALVCAQVVRIRYFGLPDGSNLVMFLDLFMAFWAMLVISALLKKRTMFDKVGQIVGIAAMLVAGHNLIWRWPEQMAYIYTAEHVEQVLEVTTQHSIVYRGTIYGL